MRCICDQCACTMIMMEKGLESRCICPCCQSTCAACMGNEAPISHVLTVDEIRARKKELPDESESNEK